ncbi:MAG TPA: hypothetical protein VFW40_13010 [Capsulimonadaceae bacterium]|nr:hypothetical protein [Capsulimonadaceae bacterium]
MPLDITAPGLVGLWVHRPETALNHLHEIQSLGFSYILPKMWEDGALYGDPAIFRQLVADADSINLGVVPWGYSRPQEIEAQIQVVADHLPASAAGIVLDAEGEWEKPGVEMLAHQLCHGIAQATGHRAPLHLSSFYAPALHPNFPYAAFLAHCASFMPQSYVEGSTPADLVVGRTMLQAYTLAKQCGKALVPTVNAPVLLPLLRTAGVTSTNVWLWDGDSEDAGVQGRESVWQPAVMKV